MAFSFFGLKKKPVIEDVEAKVPTPAAKPAPMTFDEALAAQAAAEGRVAESAAPIAAAEPEPAPATVTAQVEPEPFTPASFLAEPVAAPVVAAEVQAAPAVSAAPVAPVAAPLPEPVTADLPAAAPEEAGQMGTLKATREDVIAAYKIFLGRLPESMEVVDPRVGQAAVALLVDFLASKEFLDQAPKSQLVLAVAKKILEERKQAENNSSIADTVPPASQAQPAP